MRWFWLYAMGIAICSFLIIKYLFPLIQFDPSGTIKIIFTSIMNAVFSLSGVYFQHLVNLKNQRKSLKIILAEISAKISLNFDGSVHKTDSDVIRINSDLKIDPQLKSAIEYGKKLALDLSVQHVINEEQYKYINNLHSAFYSKNESLEKFTAKLINLL